MRWRGLGSVEGMRERGGRDGLGFVEAWLRENDKK